MQIAMMAYPHGLNAPASQYIEARADVLRPLQHSIRKLCSTFRQCRKLALQFIERPVRLACESMIQTLPVVVREGLGNEFRSISLRERQMHLCHTLTEQTCGLEIGSDQLECKRRRV